MRIFEGFQKGVNLGGWLSQFDTYSNEHFDTFTVEDDIRKIAGYGFDHVRVPVDYIVLEDEDGNPKEEGFQYLENCRQWCCKYGLNMMAWSYSNCFLNYMGLICFRMFIIWGILGFVFEATNKYTDKFVRFTRKKAFNIILPVFTLFMVINLSITTVAIVRWANRHNNNSKLSNKFERYIDKKYNDNYMEKRFMEWFFID